MAKVAPSIKEQIRNAFRIKQHAECVFMGASCRSRSLELDAGDPESWHVVGVWALEVASIGWVERQFAKTLFGEPPRATLEEAIAALERAEQLWPGFWYVNQAQLARAHDTAGNRDKAREHVRKALTMTLTADEDRTADALVAKLAVKLGVPLPK